MDKQKHSNEDESLVIWVLTFVIIAFTALTIGSYSDISPNQDQIVENNKTQIINSTISSENLIQTNSGSSRNTQNSTNSFKM